MRKFTIFTVILTIIIVVVVGEMVVEKYLPDVKAKLSSVEMPEFAMPEDLDLSKVLETNILGSEVNYDELADALLGDEQTTAENTAVVDTDLGAGFGDSSAQVDRSNVRQLGSGNNTTTQSDVPDFEDENFVSFSSNVYLREDMVRSAGFVDATIADEAHDGFLYKTIYIDDLQDVDMAKYLIKNADTMLVKVYVFNVGPLSGVNEVYELLKVRGSEGIDVQINETNEFGDGSFYLNDARRSNVAFLTVRFGALLYSFSYPKEYHPQVKNLVKLIDMEF